MAGFCLFFFFLSFFFILQLRFLYFSYVCIVNKIQDDAELKVETAEVKV
jgi:hypothetical protein